MTSDPKPLIVDADARERFCTCGKTHPEVFTRCCTGDDALEHLAHDCKETLKGETALIIDDENTHAAAGRTVADVLKKKGVAFAHMTIPGDSALSEELAGQVLARLGGARLIISVGAGTINDLGKYTADIRGLPFWTVPAAPSMNGYTSAIAALKKDGVKRTLPARPPECVYALPRVIRDAPRKLRQAGYCDILAKSVSDMDWQIESLLFSGSYCPLPSAVVSASEERYLPYPERIRDGDHDATMGLFDGLLVSGAAMRLAGSSAPASGGEHLVSHFLDMRESLTGRKPELHGLQVGAGIILSAVCYQKLAALSLRKLPGGADQIIQAEAEQIPRIWGPHAAEVEQRFFGKREMLTALDAKLPERWTDLQAVFNAVRSPDFFLDHIRRTGFDMTLAALNLSQEEFRLAAMTARVIRERITVLDIAAHAGVLQEAAEEALASLT